MKSFYKKISLISFITFICGIIIFLPAKVSNEWLLPNSIEELKSLILKEIPKSYENCEVILGDPYFINDIK